MSYVQVTQNNSKTSRFKAADAKWSSDILWHAKSWTVCSLEHHVIWNLYKKCWTTEISLGKQIYKTISPNLHLTVKTTRSSQPKHFRNFRGKLPEWRGDSLLSAQDQQGLADLAGLVYPQEFASLLLLVSTPTTSKVAITQVLIFSTSFHWLKAAESTYTILIKNW